MKLLLSPALLYFSSATLFVSLFTRLPAIQSGLEIDKAILGLALLSAPLGTFLALPVAGRINDRFTPRLTAVATLPIVAALSPVLALAPFPIFVVAFFIFGFVRTIYDVSANMISAGIEQRSGTKVIARSHGFWSVGLLVGSLYSGFMAENGVTPALQQAFVALLAMAATFAIWKYTPVDPTSEAPKRGGVYVMPDRTILMICAMVIGLCVVEGAIYDWSIFFLREVLGAEPAMAGILYAVFTIGMGATRLCGDKLRDVFGPVQLVRASAVAVALGIILLITASSLVQGGLALFLMGCGIALAFPLAVSTTITRGKGPASENLAALALTLMVSTVGVPPLLGVIAEHAGLAMSFAVLLPGVVLSFFMAPVADGRRPFRFR